MMVMVTAQFKLKLTKELNNLVVINFIANFKV